MLLFKILNSKKLKITLFKDTNQVLNKNYNYTDKLNFNDYDTIIIGSKNQKILKYIDKKKSQLKNKLIINIFGKNLPINYNKIKIINL